VKQILTNTLALLLCSASVAQGFMWNPWASEAILPKSGAVLDQSFARFLQPDLEISGAQENYQSIDSDWVLSCRHLEMKFERMKEYKFWLTNIHLQMKELRSAKEMSNLRELEQGYLDLLKTLRATLPSELFLPVAEVELVWRLGEQIRQLDLSSSSAVLLRYGHVEVAPTEKLVSVLMDRTSLKLEDGELLLQTPVSMADLCFEQEPQIVIAENCNVWSDSADSLCQNSRVVAFKSNFKEFPWRKLFHKKSLKEDYGLEGTP